MKNEPQLHITHEASTHTAYAQNDGRMCFNSFISFVECDGPQKYNKQSKI